jgi:CheY-like chemotaxis protein
MPNATSLVVDDEALIRWSLSERLKSDGYEVLEAETGRAALEKLPEGVDLVLLDYRLPDTDGVTVLRKIKEFDQDVTAAMEERPQSRALSLVVPHPADAGDGVVADDSFGAHPAGRPSGEGQRKAGEFIIRLAGALSPPSSRTRPTSFCHEEHRYVFRAF